MSETLRITILADNQAEEGLYAEHGLSLWIDTGAEKILFDTGQGTALLHNAPKLGIDLNQTNPVTALVHALNQTISIGSAGQVYQSD